MENKAKQKPLQIYTASGTSPPTRSYFIILPKQSNSEPNIQIYEPNGTVPIQTTNRTVLLKWYEGINVIAPESSVVSTLCL